LSPGDTELLDAVSVRVLASLIEKESTTPDNYPLTLNALTSACNQSSNREPVMRLEEGDVAKALEELGRRNFIRAIERRDTRVTRYRHRLAETLHLHPPEAAVLCVLMLRGPQTTGEIRTRSGRLFDFPDLARVELTLDSLMSLSPPLVTQLPRQPGQKEVRYAHLFAGEPQIDTTPAETFESPAVNDRIDALEETVNTLRAELEELRARFDGFRREFQ
jgi:uncharacterized protein YceH (UPF0502 family)